MIAAVLAVEDSRISSMFVSFFIALLIVSPFGYRRIKATLAERRELLGRVDPDAGPTESGATTGADPDEAATQLCVDTINMYRATLGLPAYERWTDAEGCSDDEAASDGKTGQAHGAFGQCEENAQNECPGWPTPAESMIDGCLELMWNEGPGADFSAHGHYINMSSTQYTKVACGFAEVNGSIWAVQNFQ